MNSIINFISEAQRRIFRKLGTTALVRDIKVEARHNPILLGFGSSRYGYESESTRVHCTIEVEIGRFPDEVPIILSDKMDQSVFTMRDIESLMLALSVSIESEKDRLAFQKKFNQWSKSKLYEIDVYSEL